MKQVQIFDIDSESLIEDGLAKVSWWIKTNQDKLSTHIIVIKREIEGEVHFLQKDNFLTAVYDSIQNWPKEQTFLVMADVNLVDNIDTWFKGTAERVVPLTALSYPFSLLLRTRNIIQDKTIQQPKNVAGKNKKFICLNGASKPHRAKLVNRLYENNYHEDGWISWVNRYGKLPKKYFSNDMWKGEDLVIDLDNESIDKGQNQEILPTQYHYAGFEIVNESIDSDTSIFLTEKVWKPILYNKIFILHGTKNSYQFLIDHGFEPYTELYDHSFDSLDKELRFEAMYSEVEKLMNYTTTEWQEIYHDKVILDKIKHNSNTFRNLHIDSWLSNLNE